MKTSGRGILRTAIYGVTITAAFVAYQIVTDTQSPLSRSPALMLIFVFLCPPSLLSIPFGGAEVGSSGFFFLWTSVALLNAAFYASIRALVARRAARRPD